MLISSLLVSLLADIFRKDVGKWQTESKGAKALCFDFALTTHEEEEGYRHLKVVVFSPNNYVQVWFQETWCVCCPEDGDAYDEGAALWVKETDHDSCWPEGIQRLLDRYADRIICFEGLSGSYRIQQVRDAGIPLPKGWS